MKKWWSVSNLSEEIGEIKVFGDISTFSWWDDDATFKDFNDQLQKLKNVKKIQLRINSNGGVVTEAVAMYNSLKRHASENGIETETYIEGVAASAATIVALASKKIYMGEGTRFMIHNPSMGVRGFAGDLRKAADHLDSIKEDIVSIYMNNSNLTKLEIENYMNEEKFFSVDEAKKAGFVHNSIELDEVQLKNNIYSVYDNEIINKYFPNLKKENKAQEEEMNLQELKAKHPNLVIELRTEIKNELEKDVINKSDEEKEKIKLAAAQGERDRIKALDEIKIINKKHSEIINKAKYEEPKNANDIIVELYNSGAFEAHNIIETTKSEAKASGLEGITEEGEEVKDVFEKSVLNAFKEEK